MDGEQKKRNSSLDYYLRLNRIFMLVALAAGSVITVRHATAPRIAGLVLVSALTIIVFLIGRISARRLGFVILAIAIVVAVLGEFARSGWGMEQREFVIGAVTLGTSALGLIFANKKTGETDMRLENIVGGFTLCCLLVAAVIVDWRGAQLFIHPTVIVFFEGMAALAEVAGERWKSRIALAALFPMASMIVGATHPEQQHPLASGIRSCYRYLDSHAIR